MLPEDPPKVDKSRIYELIRQLESDLADGYVYSPHRNADVLQLCYQALHRQENE